MGVNFRHYSLIQTLRGCQVFLCGLTYAQKNLSFNGLASIVTLQRWMAGIL